MAVLGFITEFKCFRPQLSKCLLLFLNYQLYRYYLKNIRKYVSKIKNLSQILKMSSSKKSFHPSTIQMRCKVLPLLLFHFCPSAGHSRTHFPQIGLFQMSGLEHFRPPFFKHTASFPPIII